MYPRILNVSQAIIWVLLGILTVACSEQANEDLLLAPSASSTAVKVPVFPANPEPPYIFPHAIPGDRLALPSNSGALLERAEESPVQLLRPAEVHFSGRAGQSLRGRNLGWLSGLSQPTDIVFSFDLTGSMGEELWQARRHVSEIMDHFREAFPDSRFGLVSHMDYAGRVGGCGYEESYGLAVNGDYPFRLNLPLTDDLPALNQAVNTLELGGGRDFPESYSRVFHELGSNPDIGWRSGARRLVVAWLDALPHDCQVDGIWGGALSTGPDPGVDGIAGTADDLSILEVLEEMAARDITLLVLYSGVEENPYWSRSLLELWDDYAGITGGRAIRINPDGTVPGRESMGTFVAQAISRAAGRIQHLSLEVCTPAYEGWVTRVSPHYYSFSEIQFLKSFPFEWTVSIPEGTPPGEYAFDVCLVGDGISYASQRVYVQVD